MFEDTTKGHTCYCENCLKLQAENDELKKYQYTQEYLQNEIEIRQQCLNWIEKYCMSIKNDSFDEKDGTQFAYYSGAKDAVNPILLNIIKQTKDGEDNDY